MSMLANIVGFSLFGLAARIGQLGIQKQNLFSNPGGHVLAMTAFGFGGYWAYKWDIRAGELLAMKREQIAERRRNQIALTEQQAAATLADAE